MSGPRDALRKGLSSPLSLPQVSLLQLSSLGLAQWGTNLLEMCESCCENGDTMAYLCVPVSLLFDVRVLYVYYTVGCIFLLGYLAEVPQAALHTLIPPGGVGTSPFAASFEGSCKRTPPPSPLCARVWKTWLKVLGLVSKRFFSRKLSQLRHEADSQIPCVRGCLASLDSKYSVLPTTSLLYSCWFWCLHCCLHNCHKPCSVTANPVPKTISK